MAPNGLEFLTPPIKIELRKYDLHQAENHIQRCTTIKIRNTLCVQIHAIIGKVWAIIEIQYSLFCFVISTSLLSYMSMLQ